MKRFLVIGHPLSFCLSTPVMNGAFKELGIDAEFETKDVSEEEFPKIMDELKAGRLAGVVATVPYKTPSIDFLDQRSDEVGPINAVNLITSEKGRLHGFNLDFLGALGAIKNVLPKLKGLNALVLGAGGAARAAAYGLQQEGAKVSIWNRSPDRAKTFAEKMDLEFVPDMREWKGRPNLIINATSLSDLPRQSTLVPFPLWENVKVALDAVYGKTSLFLEEAKAAQVPHAISGDIWFLNQVFPMFERLTGQKAPRALMERLTAESTLICK